MVTRLPEGAMATPLCERSDPELYTLTRLAEELARRRQEAPSSLHLLAAVATQSSPTRDWLLERDVTVEKLLQVGLELRDRRAEAVPRILRRARDVALRMGVPAVTAAHLLIALLAETTSAARIVLERSGLDVARARSAAWNIGLGVTCRRPARATPSRVASGNSPGATGRKKPIPSGVTIPLFPVERATMPKVSSEPARYRGQVVPLMVARPRRDGSPPTSGPSTSVKLKPADHAKPQPDCGRFDLDKSEFPHLRALGVNLTLKAARGELDPVVGREREIERVLDILAKRHGNNPCLVGGAGVGKTTVARGVAQWIVQQRVSGAVDPCIVVEIPIPELVSGTVARGSLGQRIAAIRQEVQSAKGRVVLFFDEVHLLFSGDGCEEAASDLRLALARGELPCIGASSSTEYRRVIEADATLNRRFTAVEVDEPSRDEALPMLHAAVKRLAGHHRVTYDDKALVQCIGWTVKYLPTRMLPDKAIAVADWAGARARRRGQTRIGAEAIAEVVAEIATLPVQRLLETDADRMLSMERLVGERVVGHADPIRRICSILRRNAAGLGAQRPIGTFLLLGPTGVGKTETAKALAQALFDSENAMVRLDMAEYAESHSLARLIGSPPGYVGHEAGGQLTEAIRRRPYQIVLLDEIEKAHPDVLQSFLGLFDEGRLTDGRGRTVDARHTVIIMTSNLGSDALSRTPRRRVGFAAESPDLAGDVQSTVVDAARSRLSPELYNRIDEVLVFLPLSPQEIHEILERLLVKVKSSLAARGVGFEMSNAAVEFVLKSGGYDFTLGARPMKRTLGRLVEAPIADRILAGELRPGCTLSIDSDGQQLLLQTSPTV